MNLLDVALENTVLTRQLEGKLDGYQYYRFPEKYQIELCNECTKLGVGCSEVLKVLKVLDKHGIKIEFKDEVD